MFPKIYWKKDEWSTADLMKPKVEPYLPEKPTELLENFVVEQSKAESNLLKQVLIKHIGRDPTTEDWKKCQKIRQTTESFTFLYDGACLGRFVREIKNDFDKELRTYVVTVTFSFKPK